MRPSPRSALAVGVFAITWAAILVRWADAPAIAIAFWRMALAAAFFAALAAALRTPVRRAWRGVDGLTGAGAALLLALHFAFWIASLDYTSVAASVVLVSTQPVFVAILGWIALKERPTPSAWLGIGLALAGAVVIAGADFALDRRALIGDLLALLGALWISLYYVLARWLRATKDLVPYVTVIYAFTAGWLLIGVASSGAGIAGYGGATWAALGLLALGPTVLGHSSMNYALRYLRAYEVNVAILGEPVGAAIWAALLLDELPGAAGRWTRRSPRPTVEDQGVASSSGFVFPNGSTRYPVSSRISVERRVSPSPCVATSTTGRACPRVRRAPSRRATSPPFTSIFTTSGGGSFQSRTRLSMVEDSAKRVPASATWIRRPSAPGRYRFGPGRPASARSNTVTFSTPFRSRWRWRKKRFSSKGSKAITRPSGPTSREPISA